MRFTSALKSKIEKFKGYKDAGIVDDRDSCIVAITAGQFPLQAIQFGLPPPVTSVYPIGRERVNFDPHALAFDSVFDFAPQIQRNRGQPIERTAFQDPENSVIIEPDLVAAVNRQFFGPT
jgi:hypothetical protein